MITSTDRTMVVDVHDLRMRYGDVEVLSGVTFSAYTGEVVALLGPNGAGKTTTIEILEGFRLRSGGSVQVLGSDPARGGDAWRARIGIVLQSWRDHQRWKVRELLHHLGGHYARYSTDGTTRPWATDDLLAAVGLSDQADARVSTLSGGQRRRLDAAIGIVGRPELLFLDEPTTGFDPEARREFHDLIHRLADERTTVLLTTHDLDEAEKLADRIVILANGRIIADGSPDDLARQKSRDAEVRWSVDGTWHVHSTDDTVGFVASLLAQHDGNLDDLEIRRASLEDAYMALVWHHESGSPQAGLRRFEVVGR